MATTHNSIDSQGLSKTRTLAALPQLLHRLDGLERLEPIDAYQAPPRDVGPWVADGSSGVPGVHARNIGTIEVTTIELPRMMTCRGAPLVVWQPCFHIGIHQSWGGHLLGAGAKFWRWTTGCHAKNHVATVNFDVPIRWITGSPFWSVKMHETNIMIIQVDIYSGSTKRNIALPSLFEAVYTSRPSRVPPSSAREPGDELVSFFFVGLLGQLTVFLLKVIHLQAYLSISRSIWIFTYSII